MYKNKQTNLEPITDATKLRSRALYWLGKRDYSVKDFKQKLDKVCEVDELKSALMEDLIKRDWLSDERYMQGMVRQKLAAGLGLNRIKMELSQHGIKADSTVNYLEELEVDWFEQAKHTYEKKYGFSRTANEFGKSREAVYKEKAKRFRFMQYRGFSPDQIKYAMEDQHSGW